MVPGYFLTTRRAAMVQLGAKPSGEVAVAEKFFTFGTVAFFLGAGWLGVHLWLIRFGEIAPKANYAEQREFHVLIQIFPFLGSFVLGYVLQAVPRLLGTDRFALRRVFFALPLLALGVLITPQFRLAGSVLLALPFAGAILYLVELFRGAKREAIFRYGLWPLLSMLAFTVLPFTSFQYGTTLVVFFWAALAAPLFAFSPVFGVAFGGGEKMGRGASAAVHISVLLTLGVLLAAHLGYAPIEIGGALAYGTIILFLILTRIYCAARRREPVIVALVLGLFWGMVGAAVLAWYGAAASDFVFHLWALGWSTPMMFAVSSHIVEIFASGLPMTERMVLWLIVMWQIVPLGRGLAVMLQLPPRFSMIVGLVVGILSLFWMVAFLKASWKINKRLRAAG
jgi:hypothetical protein